jgi:hypothetical protein
VYDQQQAHNFLKQVNVSIIYWLIKTYDAYLSWNSSIYKELWIVVYIKYISEMHCLSLSLSLYLFLSSLNCKSVFYIQPL